MATPYDTFPKFQIRWNDLYDSEYAESWSNLDDFSRVITPLNVNTK